MKKTFLYFTVAILLTMNSCSIKKSTPFCSDENCSNKIAASGETQFCPEHSSQCRDCGCYIDRDKEYCTECRMKRLNDSEDVLSSSLISAIG